MTIIVSADVHLKPGVRIAYHVYKEGLVKPWVSISIGESSEVTLYVEDPAVLGELTKTVMDARDKLLGEIEKTRRASE
jgi:hypothetical protein